MNQAIHIGTNLPVKRVICRWAFKGRGSVNCTKHCVRELCEFLPSFWHSHRIVTSQSQVSAVQTRIINGKTNGLVTYSMVTPSKVAPVLGNVLPVALYLQSTDSAWFHPGVLTRCIGGAVHPHFWDCHRFQRIRSWLVS